ncbi:hypothetical protein Hanom_Chr14g01271351 [Helianthus anomalus]
MKKLGNKSKILVNHKDHPCTFGKSWGLNALQSANHGDQPRTLEKLGTKSKQEPSVYFKSFVTILFNITYSFQMHIQTHLYLALRLHTLK